MGEVNMFTTAGYQSQLVLVGEKLKKISIVKIKDDLKLISKIQESPLTNEGLTCAGGYSNS